MAWFVAAVITEENTSTDIVVSSSLGKSEDSEDEGEETESSVETIDEESEPETEPVFGDDSFEDTDYFSFSEDELIEAFDSDAESVKPFLDYRRQIHKTRGFDLDPESIPEDMIIGYFPIDLADTRFGWPKSPDGTARGYMELMIGLCLDKYNQTQISNGMDVKMEYVLRVLARKSAGIKCYIPFMAREIPNGSLVEYQAKISGRFAKFIRIPSFADLLLHPLSLAEGSQQTKLNEKFMRCVSDF